MKSRPSHQRRAIQVASVTRGRNTPKNTNEFDAETLLLRLVSQFQKCKRPISVNFRQLLPALNATERFTHLIHPYPAKLLAHIPYLFLSTDVISRPGDLILDPFCGSGTVLLEAQLANRFAYGIDTNPLARLIARVKTTQIDSAKLRKILDEVLLRVKPKPAGSRPDVVNLEHWFHPSTVRQLQCLEEAISSVDNGEIRDFLLVCFSVCVRKVSLADPRLAVPVRLKLGQYPNDHPLKEKSDQHIRRLRRIRVSNVFAQIANANIARMERLTQRSPLPLVEIVGSDARTLIHEFSLNGKRGKCLRDNSVQLVITSPPYPGAQKYIRSSSLSLGWLRLCGTSDLRMLKGRTIGREEFNAIEFEQIPLTGIVDADKILARIFQRSPIRAVIAATYLNEMREALKEMHRVLKPGGTIVLVAANNHIAGGEFRTVDYLTAIAEQCGLSLVACLMDAIRSRGLMTKRNHTASVITREWVLIFSKGESPLWKNSNSH